MDQDQPNGVPSTPSPEGTVRSEGKLSRRGEAPNSQRYSKDTWRKLRAEFEAGTYLSQTALARKYGVHLKTLTSRMVREKWNEKQRALQSKVEQVIENKVLKEVDRQTSYLNRLAVRTEKYEQIITASMEQLGSKDSNGTPLLDPEAIDQFTRSEARLVDMNRVAYRIPTMSSQDITTGGADLGASFVMAISKLRGNPETPKLSDQDLGRVLEAEVE